MKMAHAATGFTGVRANHRFLHELSSRDETW